MVLVLSHFDEMLRKGQSETIQHYVHSFESSRDSITNLKESQWAEAVDITAVVRSQPLTVEYSELGIKDLEVIVVLTKSAVAEEDVLLWNSKYFDVIMVEEAFFRGERNYYKATCFQRVEFLGA